MASYKQKCRFYSSESLFWKKREPVSKGLSGGADLPSIDSVCRFEYLYRRFDPTEKEAAT